MINSINNKMIGYITKKILATTLIISFSLSVLVFPKTSYALDVVFDPANTAQGIITAGATTASSISLYSMQFKEYVLDPIASGLAKTVIKKLTQGIVQWINSGFEGSPAFVTNPSSYFLDLADQITGDFIFKTRGPLAELCSPFSIDVRLALAFKYHPRADDRYACTITTVIKNAKDAAEGATLNGFTAGDFSQGGWPAFFSLSTEPQNNPYGSYLQAESELAFRVGRLQQQRRDEINQGRGFLSWRKCTSESEEAYYAERELAGAEEGSEEAYYASRDLEQAQDCEIQTPGSVIVSALEENVNGPLHELQLADELNEIVNALFAQLATQILSKGLGTVSGSGPSDPKAYINTITVSETDASSDVRDNMLPNLSVYIANAREYKANKDASFTALVNTKTEYDTARACFEKRIQPPYNSPRAREEIRSLDLYVNTNLRPSLEKFLAETRKASADLQALLDIQTRSTNAKTVADLKGPSQEYSKLLQSQSVISKNDISLSKDEKDLTVSKAADLNNDAKRRMQECTAIF